MGRLIAVDRQVAGADEDTSLQARVFTFICAKSEPPVDHIPAVLHQLRYILPATRRNRSARPRGVIARETGEEP